jgi:hypothetical protein
MTVSGPFCGVQLTGSSSITTELHACLATRSSFPERGVSHSWTMLGHIRLSEMMLVERMPSQRRCYEFVFSVVTCR